MKIVAPIYKEKGSETPDLFTNLN